MALTDPHLFPSSEPCDRRTALKKVAATSLVPWALRSAPGFGQAGKMNRPNILLVHCHDLGRFLHCYKVPTVVTPNLDRLAQEGLLFENCFCTAPQCSPSRSSLFSGRYPHSTGVLGLTHAHFAWDLSPGERHLGQILKEAGYRTGAVGVVHETRSGAQRCGLDIHKPQSHAVGATEETLSLLTEWSLEPKVPFYLQVGYFEPHRTSSSMDRGADMGFVGDRLNPDDSLGVTVPGYLKDTEGTRTELAELQGAVRHMDEQVGRMMEAVDRLGLRDNTLLIFTTDHGIAMPRAKCSLYDPGLEVALIARFPGSPGWTGGRRLASMISNIDIVPSLLDLLGLEPPKNLQGRSFLPLIEGRDYPERQEIFGEITYHDYYDPRRCIRTNDHKLIANFTCAPFFMDPSQSWRPRSDTVVPVNHALAYHPPLELYDLHNDPWELTNLAEVAAHQTIRANLLGRLREHLASTHDPILQGAVTPPMHRDVLAILGTA